MAKRTRKKKVAANEEPPSGDAGKSIETAAPAPKKGKAPTHETPTVNVSSPEIDAVVEVPSLGGIQITPLNSKEIELIANLGELKYGVLRGMALERRWQEEIIRTQEKIKEWNEYEWYEKLTADMLMEEVPVEAQEKRIASELARMLREAEALENESDRRNFLVPRVEFKLEEERKLTPVERADTLIGSPIPAVVERADEPVQEKIGAGAAEAKMAEAKTTRVVTDPARIDMETAMIPPEEDFSIYGNIFYSVDRVFLEVGEKEEPGKPEEFGKKIGKAIELAEKIASKSAGAANAESPEKERVRKLRNFRTEFFEIDEGKENPQKDFDAYRLWLERKREDYKDAEGAFEALGILPGEFGRKEILRLCDNALREGRLDSTRQKQVFSLLRMLEEKRQDGEIDEATAQKNAELAYGLVLGFALQKQRELSEARIGEIGRLEEELKKKKFESATNADWKRQMAGVLTRMHALNRGSEETIRGIKGQLQDIEDDYSKKEELTEALFQMLAGDRQAGKEMMRQADEAALSQPGIKSLTPGTRMRKSMEPQAQRAQAPKGIWVAVGAAAGAALFTAGMAAHRYLGTEKGAESVLEKPAVAQVEKIEKTAERPPEKIVFAAGETPSGNIDGGDLDAGIVAETGVSIGDAGVEEALLSSVHYSRDREGLKKALDNWCVEERGLIVSGKMLRASYAAIEEQLDGSILPMDLEWVPLMLNMKFPNRLVEIAVMSDVARSDLGHAEKYAVLMRFSISLGERVRSTKSFPAIIEEANAKGIALPGIDQESHLGRIESVKTGRACLAAAYFESVSEMMGNARAAALESGMGNKQFKKEVRDALGEDAEELEKGYRRAKAAVQTERGTAGCKLLSGGKKGFNAASRGYRLNKMWAKRAQKAMKRQKELDDILGAAPQESKTGAKPAKGAASSCAGLQGLDYISCAGKQAATPGKDTGEKKMHAPKKEAGAVSKSPKMFLR